MKTCLESPAQGGDENYFEVYFVDYFLVASTLLHTDCLERGV